MTRDALDATRARMGKRGVVGARDASCAQQQHYRISA